MLSERELKLLKRLLSEPDELPDAFKNWLPKYLEIDSPRLLAENIVSNPTLTAIAASNTTYTSGQVQFTGTNITVATDTGQKVVISGPSAVAQSDQTQHVHDISLSTSAGGATAGTMAQISSGTLTLYAGNNITLSQSATNKVVISGPNTSAQQTGISSIAASNTTYTSGQVEFTGSNAATVKSSANQRIVIDVPAQTTQTQNLHNVTLSGNTSGAQAQISSGTMTLAGGNNVTLSQAGNAVTISAGAGGAATAISGIIASDATYTSGTVQFTGSNAVTVKSSAGQKVVLDVPLAVYGIIASNTTYAGASVTLTGSNMVTVKSSGLGPGVIIDATQTAQTQSNIQGIAGSNTTYNTGTVLFTGVGGGVTVSSNTGQRVDISVASVPTLSRWHNMAPGGATASIHTMLGTNNATINVFPLVPIEDLFPGNMTVSTVLFNLSLASANTSAQSWTFSFGVYTEANSTALSMLYQATTAVANAAATNNTTGWHGIRFLSMHSSLFSNSAGVATTPSFVEGSVYYGAYVMKSGGQTKGASLIGQSFHSSDARSGTLGVAAANATSLLHVPWNGVYSSGSLPTGITKSSINAQNASSPFVPYILFENVMTAL